MQGGSRLAAIVAGAGILLAATAPSAAAMSGAIEGLAVDSSLTSASVQDLSATYDRCATEQVPPELSCSWSAMALLFRPAVKSCPSSEPLPPPPGLPPPPNGEPPDQTVWLQGASGEGTLHSGSLTFPLEGANDRWLCLYLNRDVYASSASGTSTDQVSYTPPSMASDLLAAQLLHVNQLEKPLPPDTTIFMHELKRRPPVYVFHFQSTEPGSTFRCKLDGHPFAACPNSKRLGHLKPGRHVLEVVAVDAAGNEDPSPAVARFKFPKQTTPKHRLPRPKRRSQTG